jgi:cytosine/adenosine deaminase-related metal-dependent hydrolase
MDYISGDFLKVDGFSKGYLGIENNKICELGSGNPKKKPIFKGIILPSFVNMHTHIGDSFIRNKNLKLPRDLIELVAPPNGLKYRLLKNSASDEIISGMKESIKTMLESGISIFCDFRENGLNGLNNIKNALKNTDISSIILSRPEKLEFNKDEINNLLKNSNGIGLSSISDWDYSEIEKVSKETKKKGKIFALHASERIREDIDLILNLKPTFLVHMNYANKSDLIRLTENDISVVICPRSNYFFNLKSNLKLMKECGINMMVGSDNAMLNNPNVLEEIKFIKKNSNIFSIEELLNMITYNPRKVLNLDYHILDLNLISDLIVLDNKNLKTLYIKGVQMED